MSPPDGEQLQALTTGAASQSRVIPSPAFTSGFHPGGGDRHLTSNPETSGLRNDLLSAVPETKGFAPF
jgi:hypothetical protein